ncbi:MAG: hypothetical protein J7463_13795 [Roseiflexus sp.]|nr:hypothetical protein [Roseiflexus sp.]MBO9343148.1 hypothetical protein [Roseiflexus sp.]MBO9383300.1 hypothetical protein [Roseiflexus sp.]
MDPLPPRRPSVQLILAALAFLTGVTILVVRFGGILPVPDAVSTLPMTAMPAGRATEPAPVAAPTDPSLPSPTVPPMTPTPSMPVTVSPETVFPSATLLPSPAMASPTVAPIATPTSSPATVLPTIVPAPSPSPSLTPLPATLPPETAAPTPVVSPIPTSTPLPATLPPETAAPTSVVSPIPTATATADAMLVVPTMTAGSPTAALTATASPTRSTATVTLTPGSGTPTPSLTPTIRRLMLFVEGTQPRAEISYEIDDTEVLVGKDIILPWQTTIEVASDRIVRLMAEGVAEIGDLRCQITGDTVLRPIIDSKSDLYPIVKCELRGS